MDGRSARKARSRERIINAAASLLLEKGPDGVNVDAVMKAAGLTRGGFYAHFEDKDALVLAALDRAFERQMATLFRAGRGAKGKAKLVHLADRYLTLAHVDAPADGCPAPALAADAARGDKRMRALFRKHIVALVDRLAESTGLEETEAAAIATLWVGAIAMARASGDAKIAKRILDAARQHTLA
jgi:TetR/AcrR family transcriptional repressor of nem operon